MLRKMTATRRCLSIRNRFCLLQNNRVLANRQPVNQQDFNRINKLDLVICRYNRIFVANVWNILR